MTSLAKLKKGTIAKVHSFTSELKTKSMLLGIGILPGDEVRIVSESVLGSPLTIELKGGEVVAMRTNEAMLINVEVIR